MREHCSLLLLTDVLYIDCNENLNTEVLKHVLSDGKIGFVVHLMYQKVVFTDMLPRKQEQILTGRAILHRLVTFHKKQKMISL